jgi:hypothetical protein
MTTTAEKQLSIETLEIHKQIDIAAPIEIAFESMLEEIGADAQMGDGTPMPFTLEAWPGGRWFRDLGNNSGHLWGHVQVIKPPKLLEISGPLMMSYPAINHVQYRFAPHEGGTRLTFSHRGMGAITPEHRDGVNQGWAEWLERIRRAAEEKGK